MSQYANPYYDPVYAHEYYMAHRKLKGRKKGLTEEDPVEQRSASTSEERSSQRVESVSERAHTSVSTAKMTRDQVLSEIERLRSKLQGDTDSESKSSEDANRSSTAGLNSAGKAAAKKVREQLTKERKAVIDSHKEEMNGNIDSLKSDLTSANDQYKSDMEAVRTDASSKIESLRNRLKNMSKTQKARMKEKISEEIEDIRGDKDDQLDSIRATQKKTREQHSADVKKLRTDHQTFRTQTTAEYKEKYLSELDKIKTNSAYKAVKKKKSRK